METDCCYHLQQNQQQLQPGCGPLQYRSAPASLLQNHVNGTTGVIDEYGVFRYCSSHEMETLFVLSGNGSSDMQEYEEKYVKKEYQIRSLPMQGVANISVGGCTQKWAMGLVRLSNGTNGEPTSTSRLYNNHISFSSMPSSYSKPMPQIAQVENQSLGNNNGGNGHFSPNLMTDSRNIASLSGLKRARESDGDLFCGPSKLQTQNGYCGDYSNGLTHHLNLPKTYEEMDVVAKFWQFQGPVPCKIRAKRGCATHPRSIAERVRRTRISERMRTLQGLFPNIDKQTNTADMLDMAVEYIKDLQRQVKTLRDTKAKCSC